MLTALLAVLAAAGGAARSKGLLQGSSSAVELRFGPFPGLACAVGRFPAAARAVAGRLPVVVSVLAPDGRGVRRALGCLFDGDPRLLHAMAARNRLHFITLQPGTVSLAMPDADCVEPAPGLPAAVFDLQMRGAGPGARSAGCLLHRGRAPPLASRSRDAASEPPPDGAMHVRFQRVSFPTLECKYRDLKDPDVALTGLAGELNDQFQCRFLYRVTPRGQAMSALLRYLSGVYSLPLDTPDDSLPLLTLPPYECGHVGDDDADADFTVVGPSGRSVACKLSKPASVQREVS